MNFGILIIISIALFALLTFFRKWADSFILIAVAIGCAVNANLYNAGTKPVVVGDIIFSIDSALFTCFMYIVVVKYFHYSLKSTKELVYSSIAAIFISALIELCATITSQGYSWDCMRIFLNYVASIIASAVSIWVMLLIAKKLESKHTNRFFTLANSIVIGSLINSIIYYGLYALLYNGTFDETFIHSFSFSLLGSVIGKAFSIVLAEISYFVSVKLWIPKELMELKKGDLNNEKY